MSKVELVSSGVDDLSIKTEVALYLTVRKSSLLRVPTQINNLAMFLLLLPTYVFLGLVTGQNYSITITQGLVISKSYVVFTTIVAVLIFQSHLSLQKAIAILLFKDEFSMKKLAGVLGVTAGLILLLV